MPVRVVMVSDLESVGGAAIAAGRLAAGLSAHAVEVVRVVAMPDRPARSGKTISIQPNFRTGLALTAVGRVSAEWSGRLRRVLDARQLRHVLRDLQPDLINLHNVHFARWDSTVASLCAEVAPVVWTLHDMWSFTGRCAYAYECRKFLTGCDASCPTPHEYPALPPGKIAAAWRQKQQVLSDNRRVVAVTPSAWLASEARIGLWAGHRVETIPYGLSCVTYSPIEQQTARAALQLPPEDRILLMSAHVLNDRRKGGALLSEALDQISQPYTLLTMGSAPTERMAQGERVIHLGYVKDERVKRLAFSAADVVIHPAPVDNLPLVIQESLACGTPCIGFTTGGVPEMIIPGITGWLCPEIGSQALARAIDQALSELAAGMDLRASCRAFAETNYDLKRQAGRYLQLFHEIIG